MAKPTKTEDGKRFEAEVAHLYEALGFIVKRDQLIQGQQVDLVAERYLPGLGLTKLLIECKFVSKGSVSNQVVQDFMAMFVAIGVPNGFSNGVLVTNRVFSRNAKATNLGSVHLRIASDLEREAINLSDAAYAYVAEYEAGDLCKHYVAMGADGTLPTLGPPSANPAKSVEKALLDWIERERLGFVTLLADFGAGKTSLLGHLKYELSKIVLGETKQALQIPVFFPLRDLIKFHRLDDFILSVTAREFRRPIPITIFWKFLEAGSLVLLLDGFDEIVAFADEDERRNAFHKISPLINRNAGPTLMTCRPSFFVSGAEYHELLEDLIAAERRVLLTTTKSDDAARQKTQQGLERVKQHLFEKYVHDLSGRRMAKSFATLTLKTFDEDRIATYLKGYEAQFKVAIGKEAPAVHQFLRRVYDLSDLMKRPFLLEMIVKTLLTGQIDTEDDSINMGASGLYETYTSIQLEQESKKNRTLFTTSERQTFAEVLAIKMHESGYGGISHGELLESIVKDPKRFGGLREKIQAAGAQAVATDISVCSFLTRQDDDLFYFVHKSFMEFFLSRHIRISLEAAEYASLLKVRLPGEVLYFLGSSIGLDSKLQDEIVELYGRLNVEKAEDGNAKRNILGALSFAVVELQNLFFARGVLDHVSLATVKWRAIRTRDVRFDTVEWTRFVLSECIFERTTISNSKIKVLEISDSQITLALTCAVVGSLSISGQTSITLTCKEVALERLQMSGGKLQVSGDITVGLASLEGVTVAFEREAAVSRLANGTLVHCKVHCTSFPDRDPLDSATVNLIECEVYGANAAASIDYLSLRTSGRIVFLPRMTGCKGVLLVDDFDLRVIDSLKLYTWVDDVCIVDFSAYIGGLASTSKVHETIAATLGEDAKNSFIHVAKDIKSQWVLRRALGIADKTGARPEAGKSYKHETWALPWVANASRAPDYVLKAIKNGETWLQLLQD